jgi:hypothetical protein
MYLRRLYQNYIESIDFYKNDFKYFITELNGIPKDKIELVSYVYDVLYGEGEWKKHTDFAISKYNQIHKEKRNWISDTSCDYFSSNLRWNAGTCELTKKVSVFEMITGDISNNQNVIPYLQRFYDYGY